MYYKINQEPSKYESKFSIEYLNDMSHFFGLLNNEGIRKPFFEEAGFFSKISSDESVVKEYLRNAEDFDEALNRVMNEKRLKNCKI